MKTLSERDQAVIWHPFTQMKTAAKPIGIQSGKGSLIFDENGKEYIDAVSSWWVNLHGHAHPHIAQKVSEQLHNLEHVIFAGFTHEPAVELAERLLPILPGKQARLFFSDNGSTAVEVALKMSLQFWHNKGFSRKKIIAFEHSYHGDTFGGMSVSARDAFTLPFQPLLFDTLFIPAPTTGQENTSLNALKKLVQREDVAAFIFEPLVQGTAGMQMHEPEALDALIACCKEHGILTIADEVMTGFGRTGKLFAGDYLSNKPDIMCLSKGLTGGTMALGVTTCKQAVYEAFLSDDKNKTFFHGHSFTGNPVACASALASLDLTLQDECAQNIRRIHDRHQQFAKRIQNNPDITKLRIRGTILAFDIQLPEKDAHYFSSIRDYIYDFFIQRGLLLRPLGNIIYILPPYCISDDELEKIYSGIEELLKAVNHAFFT